MGHRQKDLCCGYTKTPNLEADEDPKFLHIRFHVVTLVERPFGALCFHAVVDCTNTRPACVFKMAFRVGARHPILGFRHQIVYLIGRPLLMIVGGVESKSCNQYNDKHHAGHVKGEL